ncbi:conjugal transfer protein [Salmonella enterica]|nr:conjugal transfer protein [Salmonella enterica]EEP3373122.1 conjugal transfer protein [Salmonella enterica]EFP6579682.1 conjugal transfer protein [Salmonella enterica]EGC7971449.1 conjugal transfer protein [Salmonella enterica]EIV4461674.1 conjugal transfer protein [Salmonella enterica]
MKSMKRGVWQLGDGVGAYALAIAGLVAVASVVAYAVLKPNTTAEIQGITTIMNEMRNLRNSTGYGTSDYVPALAASLGKTVTISGGKLYNKSGGDITVVGNGIGFTVTTTKLSQSDCIKMATTLSGADVTSTKINNGTTFNGEVTTVSAQTACTSGSTNTLAFSTSS